MSTTVVSTSPFPQIGQIPTRDETLAELASYAGGEENAQALRRAGASYDAAVRAFNSVLWKFNRMVNNITLTATDTFTLDSTFAAPMRAFLVNASDQEMEQVYWMDWGQLRERTHPNTGTGTAPQFYTMRNVHETGQVTIWPKLGSTILYPTLRIYFFRRIAKATGEGDRLDVPEEVYQAIFQLALATTLHKVKTSAAEASAEYALAAKLRQDVENVHRDWPDWT